jgi:phosphoglycolate phosphatase
VKRLLLFDIDGTLVRGGPAKTAFVRAMEETYGTARDADKVLFAGKTDPQIAREILSGAGRDRATIDEGLPELWERYLGHLERALPNDPMTVLPGVVRLLDELAALADVGVGLVTGNIVGGARLKLNSARLWSHFRVGGYGSDHEERDELPVIALERAREHWGRAIDAGQAVIVGDTPRDVACGRACGMRTIAVATGMFSVQQLEATGADHVLGDFAATDEVMSLLTA